MKNLSLAQTVAFGISVLLGVFIILLSIEACTKWSTFDTNARAVALIGIGVAGLLEGIVLPLLLNSLNEHTDKECKNERN